MHFIATPLFNHFINGIHVKQLNNQCQETTGAKIMPICIASVCMINNLTNIFNNKQPLMEKFLTLKGFNHTNSLQLVLR